MLFWFIFLYVFGSLLESFWSHSGSQTGAKMDPKIDQKSMEHLFGKCDWQHCDLIDPSGAKLQFSDVGRIENVIKTVSAINA